MHELVTVINGTTLTDTLIIAEGAETTHEAVIKLVRRYISDLEEVGQRVGFEIRPFETSGGTQNREIALLNEPQATLLFTFMKNTDIVRAFKVKLVKAFYAMRQLAPAGMMLVDRNYFESLLKNSGLLEENSQLLKQLLENAENQTSRRVNFTPEEDVLVLKLHDQGLSPNKIGKRIGRVKGSVRSCLRRLGRIGS
jgi:phage regulator Rha-like protein